MWENFNLLDGANILRIACALFFIPHIIGKYTEPKALELFGAFGFRPAKLWLNVACVIEIVVAAALLFAIYTRYAAALGALHLLIAAAATYRHNRKWLWHVGGAEYCVFWAIACIVVAMHGWADTTIRSFRGEYMKVAFIGLGKMGSAIAGRVLGGGHELAVYNRTASKGDDLVARGAVRAASVAEAAAFGEVVITMLENDAALWNVVSVPAGLLATLPRGRIHLAMGTYSVDTIKKLTEAHAAAGQVLVSGPVLGRPAVAAAGQLGILTGGPAEAVARCQPLFEAIGRRTFDCGTEPIGAAVAKIANNFVLACALEAMAESFVLAEKSGVTGANFLDILTDGLFGSPAYKIYGRLIAEKAYFKEPGFLTTTALKDVNLALAAGETVGVPLPSAGIVRERLVSAIARGHGEADWSVLADEQARASGLD